MSMQLSATSKWRSLARSGTTSQLIGTSLAIFVVALLVGLAMVFVGFRSQGLVETKFDPYYFGEMGKSINHGQGFAPYGNLLQRRAPLYPLMIAGVYYAFGEQPVMVYITQVLLLAAT